MDAAGRILAGAVGIASVLAQIGVAHSQSTAATELEEVVVTGYRRSLENAALEKRLNTQFTDSIFAEDLGKFPDANLAESLQRLPGIQIERDPTGEGTRVNIRGLGSQFAVQSMNGAQLQTALDNSIGYINDGRGSSLDILPTELFRSLTISKTPLASQIEGGIAGNVEMRPLRPFDTPGLQISVQAKGVYQDVAESVSPRAGAFLSNTWDSSIGRIGVLAGVAHAQREYRSDSFNTVGYTTFSLGSRCPSTQPGCNSLSFSGNSANPTYGYGGGASIPANVPAGMGFGYTDGAPLTVCGSGDTPGGTSGMSCNELSYVIMPRLGRAEVVAGDRERTAGIITSQWQPMDALTLNLDLIYAETYNEFVQHDLMIMLRSTNNNVPFDVRTNDRNILTHATFANAQLLSENRAVFSDANFFNSTLGMNFQVTDRTKIKASVAYNDSAQDQSNTTVLLRTPLGRGYSIDYDLPDGATTPILTPSFDVGDPNLGWEWDTLRVQPHRRSVTQKDAQLHVEFGDAAQFKLSGGAQYTAFDREILTWDVSGCATNANGGTCGGTSTVASDFPGALAVIPNSQLGNYMMSWPYGRLYSNASFDVGLNNGWAVPNYSAIASAINIDYFEQQLDPATRLNTLNPRTVDETTQAAYVQVDGAWEVLSKRVRYNAGVRALTTDQKVAGVVNDPTAGRGVQRFGNKYTEYLPSFNAAVDLTDALVLRLAGGRAMTRPNPGDLAPAFELSLGGDTLTLGNPALEPYFSDQLDVGVEWYITNRNTLALNLWQKNIDGFTTIYRTTQRFDTLGIVFENLSQITRDGLTVLGGGDPNAALVSVSQRQNTPEIITLTGLELTLLQPLDFVLEGLGFTANYTHIDQSSRGAPAATSGTRENPGSAVTGLSPNTYNLSVYFERAGFSSRVSYNYRDPYVAFLGPQNNIEGNGVAAESEYLDASVSIALPWFNARITFEAQNLLNEVQFTNIDGDPSLPYNAYAPGRTYVVGLSARL